MIGFQDRNSISRGDRVKHQICLTRKPFETMNRAFARECRLNADLIVGIVTDRESDQASTCDFHRNGAAQRMPMGMLNATAHSVCATGAPGSLRSAAHCEHPWRRDFIGWRLGSIFSPMLVPARPSVS